MTTVTFQGRTYTPEVLATMTNQELLDLHNRVAALSGESEVESFPEDRIAQEMTWDMLMGGTTDVRDPAPREKTDEFDRAAPLKPAEKVKRKMLFKFPAEKEIRPPKAGTLRAQVLEAMRRGVTYNDVVMLVKDFDRQRGVDEKNVERRAYEVVRLLHYYCGYGMDQDVNGVIKIKE